MLNAFRHHRGRHPRRGSRLLRVGLCSTPFGITEVGTSPASAGPTGDVRAQRLSASQRSAPGSGRRSWRRVRCAQRLSASQRSAQAIIERLSAVRTSAQRLSASQRSAPAGRARRGPTEKVCSTPFGITEVGTFVTARVRQQREVCSTPFGITEVGTRLGTADHRHLWPRAQRLSASQRSAPPGVGTNACPSTVLNAFRHHRGRHAIRLDA